MRTVSRPGERHHNATLTAADVAVIRQRYAAGGIFQRELASEFGVRHGTVSKIVKGQRWKG